MHPIDYIKLPEEQVIKTIKRGNKFAHLEVRSKKPLSPAQLKELITKEYSFTIRDVCELLKVHRPWVANYIRPYVHYLYITPRYKMFEEETMPICLHKQETLDLIHKGIISVARRTVRMGYRELLQEDQWEDYRMLMDKKNERMAALDKEIEQAQTPEEAANLYDKKDRINRQRMGDIRYFMIDKVFQLWDRGVANKTKRTQCEWIELPAEERPKDWDDMQTWKVVHDLMGYGDSAEMVHRQLFVQGAIRIQLAIEDLDGKKSEKVYYITPDDDYIQECYEKESMPVYLIAYEQAKKIRDLLKNK